VTVPPIWGWGLATFVLVHGAMHGGWCWREVRLRLSGNGHEVYAPTLTGQGDRRQGLTPQVGIAAHVTDLTDLLWFEDLRDVHLVLHSYAGVLAGPVAEQAAGRLASVTYLAAFIARPGQCLLDVEPPDVARKGHQLHGQWAGQTRSSLRRLRLCASIRCGWLRPPAARGGPGRRSRRS
jgi:pimeloyl-ACP methyl ester carboxylesterase